MDQTQLSRITNFYEPDLTRAHQQLGALAGDWDCEGDISGSERIYGRENYEWLEGGFFLIYKWERVALARRHVGVGTIGFDSEEQKFVARFVDSLGYARHYDVAVTETAIDFSGDTERAHFAISNGGLVMDVTWEQRTPTQEWAPLCQLRMIKRPLRS